MGKEKKTLGIKTARYFTKNCSKCDFEYPNWFTNCPKCGAAWNDTEIKSTSHIKESQKKTIKIIVKITEEDFNKAIQKVNLIFSADQGQSWYQMQMDAKIDYYIAEIAEIPIGSVVIYYIEVYLEDGERIIENNDNNYYYYKVGGPIEKVEQTSSNKKNKTKINKVKTQTPESLALNTTSEKTHIPKTYITKNMIERSTTIPKEVISPSKEEFSQFQEVNNLTIFGKPQTMIDPDLKICTHCNSKIKKIWSTCPICGKNL